MDECLFQHDDAQTHAWAPKTKPIKWSFQRHNAKNHVVVCGVISAESGKILMDGKYGSYNSEEMCRILREVKSKMGK